MEDKMLELLELLVDGANMYRQPKRQMLSGTSLRYISHAIKAQYGCFHAEALAKLHPDPR